MKIIKYEEKYLKSLVEIWNNDVATKTIYKPFTEKTFVQKFINNSYQDKSILYVSLINDKPVGFGHAIYRENNLDTPGYITCVVVKKEFQRQKIGTKILFSLEQFLKNNNKTYVRQLFLNPISLEWYIPNTNNHDHPNAPGVLFNSDWYLFLVNNGYKINGQQQDAYYLNITNYQMPEDILNAKLLNAKDGYNITFYNKEKHYGFEELFKALNNDLWLEAVNNNLKKDNPDPMLIVEKDNLILGWTGPLFTQKSKRGYFAGIGVHPNAQGRGLGKILFSELLIQSKNNGAEFMSLFTGSENPARNMYLKAGFSLVQSFAILKKEL